MRAVVFEGFGSPDVLTVAQLPEPHAGPGQIRIEVRVAGVSPVDLALRAGDSPSAATLALPHVPGVDAAGVVDEVGPGVEGIAPGDEVFGLVDLARLGGASAQYAVLAHWTRRPAALSWNEAGAAATGVETATRALDLLSVTAGTSLVIDGAAGGVGSIAVQLAAARGAHVLGTASPASHDLLTTLGATPVPYGPGLPGRLRALGVTRVDRALDVAGAGSLAELVTLAGTPEQVVTLADFTASQHGVRLSTGELGGQAGGHHGLPQAAALAEQGRFRVPVRAVLPAGRAAQAHATAARPPRAGKVVLDLRTWV